METSSKTRGRETIPRRVKGDIEDISSELDKRGERLHFLDEIPRVLLLSRSPHWIEKSRLGKSENPSSYGSKRCRCIRRCWKDNGRFQSYDGSSQPRATVDWKDKLIVRSSVIAPDSSLSTIGRATRTRMTTMNIHKRLIEQYLQQYYRTDHYAPCQSCLHTAELDYSGAMLLKL
ncbi:hypothetical protein TNCV_1967181 [Trichonephila clavipes]|nr:hypothetical protein TNCV_1967181 [Trichonephila clavipes]